ncbi:MAG: MFS transporter [Bacteroidales bacterium]|jgi:OPA family glycerol-3-phosphate transporter-like MFS transporter/OPA family sugar phosphate sensor protein UhpC-like MFS transporter|nr:MFS transporter [Bacteroidales bacterium]
MAYANMSAETAKKFKYWQTRTIIASMIGYALFYFVRKNLSIAMPAMQADLGITKTGLGIFLTLHGLLYGVSKFANGFIGDRVNARIFMVTGLALSALCSIVFGLSSAALVFGLVWMLNGWFQGMGFPPCARLLTHWVPPNELATKMSVWNTSHSIGAGLVVIICGYIVAMGWRWCFYIPAVIALCGAVFLWAVMRDTPGSVGLPELHPEKAGTKEEKSAEFKRFVRKKVFGNPYIWMIAIANFFVYTVRFAVLDWGPTLLSEAKGLSLQHAGWMVASFEIAGIVGMLAAGRFTDRVLGGRGARTCVICMTFAVLFIFLFWRMSAPPVWLATAVLGAAGFFIYGPQALVGIAVANLATNKAAATAVGFTGLFGYASALLSGWGLGALAERYGWSYALGGLIAAALAGTVMFLFAWPAKAHGYDEEARPLTAEEGGSQEISEVRKG